MKNANGYPTVLREASLQALPRRLGDAPPVSSGLEGTPRPAIHDLPAAQPHPVPPSWGDAATAPDKPAPPPDMDEQDLIVEQAREKGYAEGLEAGRTAGFGAGYQEGVISGRRAGESEGAELYRRGLAEIEVLLVRLREGIDNRMRSVEDDIVELVFVAISRIIGAAAPTRDGTLGLVRTAIAEFRHRPLTAIRVHPQDMETLRNDPVMAQMLQTHGESPLLQWVADERVMAGGCMLDMPFGSIDARLDRQLQRVCAILKEARSTGGAAEC